MRTDLELTKEQEAMFQPGCFVVLHPDSKHPDAGRVGKIISRDGSEMLVEFWQDDLSVTERGMKMFRNLGWGYTAATEGKA